MNPSAIFFDAVGTLIHPNPPAVHVYAQFGKEYGTRRDLAVIADRFREAFQAEEDVDGRSGLVTNEEREKRRWRNIVAHVLDDVREPEACFTAIYDHFARPGAWVCDPAAEMVLRSLSERGYRIGLASNYDHRLRSVQKGLEPLRFIQHLVISSEVGFRKPAPEFFQEVCRAVDLPAQAILFVGDDRSNDFEGALRAGLGALLLDPRGHEPLLGRKRLQSLEELILLGPQSGETLSGFV